MPGTGRAGASTGANRTSGSRSTTGRRSSSSRAQASHQQASHMAAQIYRRLAGRPLKPYRYRDFGSLVSLGEYSTVGNMMGGLFGGSLMIEGAFAHLMYVSLYKMHEFALHGFFKVALDTLAFRTRHAGLGRLEESSRARP